MTVQFMTAGGATTTNAAAFEGGGNENGLSVKQRMGTRSW